MSSYWLGGVSKNQADLQERFKATLAVGQGRDEQRADENQARNQPIQQPLLSACLSHQKGKDKKESESAREEGTPWT